MSYYHERKTAAAKAYLEQSEAKDRAEQRARDNPADFLTGREWLTEYHRTHPRRTEFNWSPRLTDSNYLQGVKNVEDTEEDQAQ